jgi:hypothetical protein
MNKTLPVHWMVVGFLIAIATLIAGCSIAMEATRPAPVRLAQFDPGESRDDVVAKLGEPVSTTIDADGASCDLYSLPLSGYGNWAKAGIAFGEFLADVGTIGIAEVVSTPTEAGTRNKKTPVWFCYRKGLLARVTPKRLEGEDLAASERIAKTAPAPATSPAAVSTQAGATSPAAVDTQAAASASSPAAVSTQAAAAESPVAASTQAAAASLPTLEGTAPTSPAESH